MKALKYYSQYGQDKMILEILGYKKDGFFIDIGANDGISFSNTKCLEELGWKGICVEPDNNVFEKLVNNRKSININAAVGDRNGIAKFTRIVGKAQMLSGISSQYSEEHLDRVKSEVEVNGDKLEEIEVRMVTFDELMKNVSRGRTIDYVSIDTEGSEPTILKSIDFEKWDISILSVEDNYRDIEVRNYMRIQGYKVWECRRDNVFIKNTLNNVKEQAFLQKVRNKNWSRVFRRLKM